MARDSKDMVNMCRSKSTNRPLQEFWVKKYTKMFLDEKWKFSSVQIK